MVLTVTFSSLPTVLPFNKVTNIHPCFSPSKGLSIGSATGHLHIMPYSKPCSTNPQHPLSSPLESRPAAPLVLMSRPSPYKDLSSQGSSVSLRRPEWMRFAVCHRSPEVASPLSPLLAFKPSGSEMHIRINIAMMFLVAISPER